MLKSIYLHDLPSLQQVCELRMLAPALETITMRGCRSLRRLPAIDAAGHLKEGHSRPIVDCEKDLWDKLEWDGLHAGHHPSFFRTRHPAYYRMKMPRGSLLR
ncbi:hypothetical protein E2562_023480 [Oryza meyeriana var. granulata]|uniref:Uncharacterized protein n=1 Tax=Oryza meyeriana var. granulata TaxID=110450 RepID=A0A6G1BY22_9ORYZ|nr:hypothetical protein E2562_023480 [Oryza meyeriana var. granulata]